MKELSRKIITTINDAADQFGSDEVLEQLFPGMTLGELVNEMYEGGLLPSDVLEEFLEDYNEEE